jgi:nucleoside-diphosphate kinase
MAEANVRYSFKVEWFDTVASLLRPYELYYFPHDKTLEMVRLRCPLGCPSRPHDGGARVAC